MKHIITKGKISLLIPEGSGGGLTGEVHLVTYLKNKYVVRKCQDMKTAKYYEFVSKKLGRKEFLPKFLGRYGKDVVYEYIEGRDLRNNEEKQSIYVQIGKIAAILNQVNVNQIETKKSIDKDFIKKLKELLSGNYTPSNKVLMRRKLSKIKKKPMAILSKKDVKGIKHLYSFLNGKVKLKFTFDLAGFDSGNFRLSGKKVYLVDIEAIKSTLKYLGLAKHFLKWEKKDPKRKAVIKGYRSISSLKPLQGHYSDLCVLIYIIQSLHFKAQVIRDSNEEIKRLHFLLDKYRINKQ